MSGKKRDLLRVLVDLDAPANVYNAGWLISWVKNGWTSGHAEISEGEDPENPSRATAEWYYDQQAGGWWQLDWLTGGKHWVNFWGEYKGGRAIVTEVILGCDKSKRFYPRVREVLEQYGIKFRRRKEAGNEKATTNRDL